MQTGTIVQEGRNVITTDADGTRHVTKYHNHAVANHAVLAMRMRIDDDGPVTFGRLIQRWDEHHGKIRLTTESYRCYKSVIKNHLLPRFENTTTDEMNRSTVDLFIRDLRKKGMRGRAITSIVMKLQAILGVAKKWGYIDKNPVREIDAIFLDTNPLTR